MKSLAPELRTLNRWFCTCIESVVFQFRDPRSKLVYNYYYYYLLLLTI